ncbi:META domain-containing protein [Deinococcus sp. KNUC1210]|uniref:META domain-containing protein n=1 Tax=Deinococcus sp. KNUC1210 TaxID=2917691 RepID=UPI001EF0F0DC|nr:META domain-containing protein [Deinococcus sp. KNUC1210]ULH16265.1 META domain-containing protein [Deinococcus sp. KNUC1210]
MNTSSRLLGAALTLLVAATPAQASTTSVAPLILIDGTWAVARLSSGQTMPTGVRAVLNLVGGRVSGTTGCNSVMGRYTHAGSDLAFQGLASTRKFCAGVAGTTETLVLRSLSGAQKVAVYGPTGQKSMRISGTGGTLYLVKQK